MIQDYIETVLKRLEEDKKSIMEAWAAGTFTAETVEGTAQLNAKWIGKVETIDDLMLLMKDLYEEYKDE